MMHEVRARLDFVDAADGLDDGPAPRADGDAEAISTDEPPSLIGNAVGDLGRMQAAVNAAGKGLQLLPELAFRGLLGPTLTKQIDRRQIGQMNEEGEQCRQRGRSTTRTEPDFDQGLDLVLDHHRSDQDGPGRPGRFPRSAVFGLLGLDGLEPPVLGEGSSGTFQVQAAGSVGVLDLERSLGRASQTAPPGAARACKVCWRNVRK